MQNSCCQEPWLCLETYVDTEGRTHHSSLRLWKMKWTERLIRTPETAAVQAPARTQRLSWLLAFPVFSFYLFLLYFFPSSLPLFLLSFFFFFFFCNFLTKTQVNWGQEKDMGDRKRCRLRSRRSSYYFKCMRCADNRPAFSALFKHLVFFTH